MWAVAIAAAVWALGTFLVAIFVFAGFGRGQGRPAGAAGSSQRVHLAIPARAWRLDPGSQVGYRIAEHGPLAGLTGGEARGSTGAVHGYLTIHGGGARVVVVADLTRLHGDEPGRDAFLRGRALETQRFPTARFRSTPGVRLPRRAGTIALRGHLTLHGRTRLVTIRARIRREPGDITARGEVPLVLKRFGIAPPSLGAVSVAPRGTLIFRLSFSRR